MRILLSICFSVSLCLLWSCNGIPTPEPTPEPTPAPTPWECQLGYPGCHQYEPPLQCSSEEAPCWHNPTGQPEHCEEAPRCNEPPPPELPEPQCASFTNRGGVLDIQGDDCDCYFGQVWHPCPEPTGCPHGFPQGQNDDMTGGPVMSDFAETVDAAMQGITGCVIGDWRCPTNMAPDEWMHSVIDKIKLTGLCAGRHIDTTPGGTDEIAVTANCKGWWEGYKIYNYGTGAVIWTGQGKRPAWKLNDPSVCGVDPTPPPTPPPGGVCVDPDPTGYGAEFKLKKHHQDWDSTYRVVGRAYCDQVCSPLEPDVCFTGRNACPLRMEGDPEREVCEEQEIGDQKWWCDGQPIEPNENAAQARCHGHVKTCTEDGRTCGEADW